MTQEDKTNHNLQAIRYAASGISKSKLITPRGMIRYWQRIEKYIENDMKDMNIVYRYLIRRMAHRSLIISVIQYRQKLGMNGKHQTPTGIYGPWVVNMDGSIDLGGNEVYYHKSTWHEDKHHLSHMMTKVWLQDTAFEYLRALAHSAKIQGVKSFTVNVERITTEK